MTVPSGQHEKAGGLEQKHRAIRELHLSILSVRFLTFPLLRCGSSYPALADWANLCRTFRGYLPGAACFGAKRTAFEAGETRIHDSET